MKHEEKQALFNAIQAAEAAGDVEMAANLSRQFPLAPLLGFGLAESLGYEKAKALGVNFEEVDEAYGSNWHIGL